MRRRYQYGLPALVLAAVPAGALIYALSDRQASINRYASIPRPPRIRPDYDGTVIPPNIAPLNFTVVEKGSHYAIRVHADGGETIEVFSRSPGIVIPEDGWHRLLDANRGKELRIDVFVKTENDRWGRFETITNRIAREEIDDFLVYRKIRPAHVRWSRIGIYQRDLRNYDESCVLHNDRYRRGCLNCHTFCNNRAETMLIGIRSEEYGSGTLLVAGGTVHKIGTKFGYTSWHPSGRVAAYSISRVRQFFHTARNEVRDVIDLDSLLAYYLVGPKIVKTSPKIARKDRLETYPAWSPDGRYLYFCSGAKLWGNDDGRAAGLYRDVKYDLMRVSYDVARDEWGEPETVLGAQDTGLSILEPRISPDGRWLLFCMCDYGCFPVHQQSSDLYLMDLEAGRETGEYTYRRLEINSDQSESWHSWSSNSRWIAFSSKRDYGVFTRSYLSYVDDAGRVHKSLLLPQKDPVFYDSCLETFSVPELVGERVRVTGEKLARVVRGPCTIDADLPLTGATPKAGTAPRPRGQGKVSPLPPASADGNSMSPYE